MWLVIIVFIILTVVFIYAMGYQKRGTRCPEPLEDTKDQVCFDGNGKSQRRGRGHDDESVETLLNRIAWGAKHAQTHYLYSMSYIIAYAIMLGVVALVLQRCPTVYEMVMIIAGAFLITFSVFTLFNFHTDRYPLYYIRENVGRIKEKLKLDTTFKNPGKPIHDNRIPFRTFVQDKLER